MVKRRTGKYKLSARAGKSKLMARAGKHKLGARVGGREKQVPVLNLAITDHILFIFFS